MKSELYSELASILDESREDLERLGMQLCNDPNLISQHMVSLQALDRIGQIQNAIALLLRSTDPVQSTYDITMESLRERLLRLTRPELAETA